MAQILYIDTSGKFSKMMLFHHDIILAAKTTTEANQHAQSINIHIKELLEETSMSWQEISAVAVMNGPGSYTGLRIGLASAKGFCFAFNIPLILINHFDQMNYCKRSGGDNAYILKARENEYFYKSYSMSGEVTGNVSLIDTPELIAKTQSENVSLFTSDENLLLLSGQIHIINIADADIRAFVSEQYEAGKFADLISCEPFYLKNVHINKINKL